jgi:hypothetical protein
MDNAISALRRLASECMMPNEETLVHRDAEWRLQQARALLDLFEHDCGRPAATLDEVREWACAQEQVHLRFRLTQHLHCAA